MPLSRPRHPLGIAILAEDLGDRRPARDDLTWAPRRPTPDRADRRPGPDRERR